MPEFLKKHPFPVEAHFVFSLVVTYAVPAEEVRAMLPPCLEPDMHMEKWAFVTAAMVQTEALRPEGFPRIMGNDFFLTGYRFFVRYRDQRGRNLRGLYILGSETDKWKMKVLGNIFTHYNYRTIDIVQETAENSWQIESVKGGFHINAQAIGPVDLPEGSPFADWKEARRFAGPLPFTFTWQEERNEVLIIEGVRENWEPSPLKINSCRFSFIESLGFSEARLANAFVVKDIPYHWKKGRSEPWPH